ncbi:hypothetical protein EMPS_03978 [Entomortierella parvispora]|uniref:Uncharacterized protein n=1 Tax=Entomortierella parvispora TaxID=205924 RepID=A0A9P3H7U2_9FUNG|nr:hypothetical protein EMPS_03978 [Entomortierella parvispora]
MDPETLITANSAVAHESLAPLLPRVSPPPYEEAIVRSLNDPLTGSSPNPFSRVATVAPHDFPHDDDQGIQDFEEDEREYEASRPLKMGKIPDARAQYTYIQPDPVRSKAPVRRDGPGTGPCNVMARSATPHHQTGQSLPSAPPMGADASTAQRTYLPPPGPPPPLQESQTSGYTADKPMYSPPDHPPPSNGSSSGSAPTLPVSYQAPAVPFAGVPDAPGLINPQDISIADFKRTKKGVESYDRVLADPYQLYRFFVARNDRPSMNVVINGYHIERRQETVKDSDGHSKCVTKNVRVDDFNITIDLTPYIQARGTLYTTPDPKTGVAPSLREVMEQYADNENPFKEIHMHKTVVWDYAELTGAITHAIRCTNYRYSIDISYPCSNNVVKAFSSAPLAEFMRNGWTKALCCLTGLGLIFYPARAFYKEVDETLKSEFEMSISTRDFYNSHYWAIVDQVQYS